MKPQRRLVARFLLAVTLVGATTAHHHSILEDASSSRPAVPVLDARCALTHALSLHAIPRIVERDACWACHWNRVFTAPRGAALPVPFWTGRSLACPTSRAAHNLARFPRFSRGPPSIA